VQTQLTGLDYHSLVSKLMAPVLGGNGDTNSRATAGAPSEVVQLHKQALEFQRTAFKWGYARSLVHHIVKFPQWFFYYRITRDSIFYGIRRHCNIKCYKVTNINDKPTKVHLH